MCMYAILGFKRAIFYRSYFFFALFKLAMPLLGFMKSVLNKKHIIILIFTHNEDLIWGSPFPWPPLV